MPVVGMDKLSRKIQARVARARDVHGRGAAVVYGTDHTVAVHEDLARVHPNGQAKFLEQPERELRPALAAGIAADVKAGIDPVQAQVNAAEALLAASLPLVPVQTGELRDSGHVRRLEGGEL